MNVGSFCFLRVVFCQRHQIASFFMLFISCEKKITIKVLCYRTHTHKYIYISPCHYLINKKKKKKSQKSRLAFRKVSTPFNSKARRTSFVSSTFNYLSWSHFIVWRNYRLSSIQCWSSWLWFAGFCSCTGLSVFHLIISFSLDLGPVRPCHELAGTSTPGNTGNLFQCFH